MNDCLKIVVAGDVDSGKSTLIGRFMHEMGFLPAEKMGGDFEFAYLLDSFEEERRGQLTIDTTQAYCRGKQGRDFIFIDVPGHKELIRNMLTGSSYADVAILTVDARESVEEQTRRHAFILKFLGINDMIVVLNKMDAVEFKEGIFEKVKKATLKALSDFNIEPIALLPISAKEGINLTIVSARLSWYKGECLLSALNKFTKKNTQGDFRFAIQDIYDDGEGKIAVGEVISGKISKSERAVLLPPGRELTLKTIKAFGERKSKAVAGEAVGLKFDHMEGLMRGQVVCRPKLPDTKTEIRAKIFCIKPVEIKENLQFRSVTQDRIARVKEVAAVRDSSTLENKFNLSSMEAADIAELTIHLDSPIVVENASQASSLSRFVLKDAENDICAVGIID